MSKLAVFIFSWLAEQLVPTSSPRHPGAQHGHIRTSEADLTMVLFVLPTNVLFPLYSSSFFFFNETRIRQEHNKNFSLYPRGKAEKLILPGPELLGTQMALHWKQTPLCDGLHCIGCGKPPKTKHKHSLSLQPQIGVETIQYKQGTIYKLDPKMSPLSLLCLFFLLFFF